MRREDTKTRIGFWIDNDLLRRCDTCWKANDFASRNAFVNRAIEEFIVTTTLKNMDDMVVSRLADAIAKATDAGTVKISKGLFRYAVILEMIMHILAAECNVNANQLRNLRGRAIKDAKQTRGRIDLEAIADFQNGVSPQYYPPIPEEADDYECE